MPTINSVTPLARLKGGKAQAGKGGPFVGSRNVEARALLLVSVSLLVGLWLVYQVKSRRPLDFSTLTENTSGAGLTLKAEDGGSPIKLLNLNRVESPDEIVPYLTEFEAGDERAFAARKIADALAKKKSFEHVGALGVIRLAKGDLNGWPGLDDFRERLDNAEIAAAERRAQRERERGFDPVQRLRELFRKEEETPVSVPLVPQVAPVKPAFVVRTPAEFRRAFLASAALLLLSFWGLHLYWRARRFRGDQIILPNTFALCALGFLMMTSLRDPLRDTLNLAGFAGGVFGGCVVVAALTSFDYYRLYYALRSRVARADFYITAAPIAAALILSLLLVVTGKGPSGSDGALVNLDFGLGPQFQPSEVIRLLVIFFIAGYFGRRWELVHNLDEPKAKPVSLPRVKDVAAVFACVAAVLSFFVIQKDLGPALMMAGLFLIVFAIVRGGPWLSLAGLTSIVGGYLFNYYVFTFSQTAADRLNIWRSPWDTTVRGGEQVTHSLWALAAGGVTGTGLGLGEPRLVPAAHTDLILSSVGEEFGFVGLLLICALYATLLHRCFRVALRAPSAYGYFLAAGVAIISGLQVLFIGAAVLGLVPLSGVVTPFLSYGSSSIVMNFAAFGVVLVISDQGGAAAPDVERTFARPTRYVARLRAAGARRHGQSRLGAGREGRRDNPAERARATAR